MKASRDVLCLAGLVFAFGIARAEGLNLGRDRLVGSFWGVEMGVIEKPRLFANEPRVQGLNLSLVGKAPLGSSLGVFGKLGTNYARSDASVMGASPALAGDSSFGFAYGAGVSYSFTPRLSATLEWDSHDMRLTGSARDPVRSTSLGLRYSY